MPTEAADPRYREIDRWPTEAAVEAMLESQLAAIAALKSQAGAMAAAIDAEGQVSVTGGTLIVLGYGRVNTGSSVKTSSLSLHASGCHTVVIDGTAYTFTNAYSYGAARCYSSVSVSA